MISVAQAELDRVLEQVDEYGSQMAHIQEEIKSFQFHADKQETHQQAILNQTAKYKEGIPVLEMEQQQTYPHDVAELQNQNLQIQRKIATMNEDIAQLERRRAAAPAMMTQLANVNLNR